jgi:anthranilate phosphoribosyltransferase
MAHAAGPRKEMGIPTVFNFLGPLTNPARPASQIVGVADARMQPVLAGVLAERGTRAYVVRGGDGIDEITLTGPTEVRDVKEGSIEATSLDPTSLGLTLVAPEALAGGDPAHNAAVARSVLRGEPGPARDIVSLNASAALTVAGVASDLGDGLQRAAESLDSGKAVDVLDRWIEASNRS